MTTCASDERGRAPSRQATTLAAYYTQRFLIVFSRSTPLIDAQRRRRLEHLHLLAHEYFHYWHNFSTVVGVKLFSFAQALMAEFSRTLSESLDGTSDGMVAIPAEERSRPAELLQLIENLEGMRDLEDGSTESDVCEMDGDF